MKIVFNYNEHRISYYFWGEEEKKKKKKGITNLVGKTFMKNLHDIACYVDKQFVIFNERNIDFEIISKESGHENTIKMIQIK